MCDFRDIKCLKQIEYDDIKKLTIPGVYRVCVSGSFYIYFDGKNAYTLGKIIYGKTKYLKIGGK